MDEFKRVLIRAEVVDEVTDRLDALRGVASSVSRSLETGEHEAVSDAVVALRGLAAEVTRIMVDLDVCAWTNAPKVRKVAA